MTDNLALTMNNLSKKSASYRIQGKGFRPIVGDLAPLSFGLVTVPFAPHYEISWNNFFDAKAAKASSIVSFDGNKVIVTEPA